MGPELGYNALGGVSSTLWLLLWLYTLGFTGAMSFRMGILARSSESCFFSYVIIGVLSFTIVIPSTTLAYLLCTTRLSLQIPPITSRFNPIQYSLRRQRKSIGVRKESVRRRENFPLSLCTTNSSRHGLQVRPTHQSARSVTDITTASTRPNNYT